MANDKNASGREIKAAVVREKGGPFKLEPLTLEEPRRDEVLVKIVAAGMCHTDMVARDKVYDVPHPIVLGHEGAGIVESGGWDGHARHHPVRRDGDGVAYCLPASDRERHSRPQVHCFVNAGEEPLPTLRKGKVDHAQVRRVEQQDGRLRRLRQRGRRARGGAPAAGDGRGAGRQRAHQVMLSLREDFENYSVFKPREFHENALGQVFDRVIAWGDALRALRQKRA
jgi:hypothetical protein